MSDVKTDDVEENETLDVKDDKVEDDQTKPEQKGSLERNLGLFSSVGVIVGCIIGSGIFISPAGVIQGLF